MANVLDREKQQQILALGRLGWTLRRIEHETGIRRETVSGYLKRAGIEVRRPGRWRPPDSKPARGVITDSSADSKPAIRVITDSAPPPHPGRNPSASACEPYRDLIEQAIRLGRNATVIWQDLVDDHGFDAGDQSVRRFVRKLRGTRIHAAHPVIGTAPVSKARWITGATARWCVIPRRASTVACGCSFSHWGAVARACGCSPSSRPTQRGDQEEPRLVDEDEVRLPARCVFFTCGQRAAAPRGQHRCRSLPSHDTTPPDARVLHSLGRNR